MHAGRHMIRRPDVAPRVGLLEAIAAIPAVPDATHEPAAFTPGARVQARVEAQLAGGGFRVLVAGTPMQMQLPPGIRPGATLELMFIAAKPRPTFALLNQASVGGSNTLLSLAARLLGTLVQEAKTDSVATPPYQTMPVLEDPPANTGEFGTRLQQAFSQSGLFYESHQAQWLAGRRTREQLLREPQGRLSAPLPHGKTETADPAAPSRAAAPSEPLAPDAPGAIERMVHKDALPLVQQQLAALDTGQMPWRGEIWPGQTMDWEVGSESPAPDIGEEPPRWHSRLRLTLPRLGEITALLVLDSHGVRITMSAGNASVAETLRTGQAALVQSMQSSGLNVSGIEVQHDDGT